MSSFDPDEWAARVRAEAGRSAARLARAEARRALEQQPGYVPTAQPPHPTDGAPVAPEDHE